MVIRVTPCSAAKSSVFFRALPRTKNGIFFSSASAEASQPTGAGASGAAGIDVAMGDVRVGAAQLRYDPARTNVDAIEDAIADEGYTAFVSEG